MNDIFYFLADLYPWWGIPLGLILAELGNKYRRSGNRQKMFRCMTASVILLALAAAYFVFNGKKYIRPAMQQMENSVTR